MTVLACAQRKAAARSSVFWYERCADVIKEDFNGPLFADFSNSKCIELLDGKATRQVFSGENILVVRNVIREDLVLPAHSHPHEQMVYISQGACELVLDGGAIHKSMGPGEICLLPSGRLHEVRSKANTVIWDIFSPIRDDIIQSMLG